MGSESDTAGASDNALLTTGGCWCGSTQPFVIASGGETLEGLKYACDMEPNDDQRGDVAATPRAN